MLILNGNCNGLFGNVLGSIGKEVIWQKGTNKTK